MKKGTVKLPVSAVRKRERCSRHNRDDVEARLYGRCQTPLLAGDAVVLAAGSFAHMCSGNIPATLMGRNASTPLSPLAYRLQRALHAEASVQRSLSQQAVW